MSISQNNTFGFVNIAGCQVKVRPSEHCLTAKLSYSVGDEITLDEVLFVAREGEVWVGTPFLKGKRVKAKVVAHGKEDKVIVFKKKRRKGYKKKQGHRQQYTKLLIESIE